MKAITGASKGRLTKREERINSHEQRNNDSGLKNELEWIMTMNECNIRKDNFKTNYTEMKSMAQSINKSIHEFIQIAANCWIQIDYWIDLAPFDDFRQLNIETTLFSIV